MPRFYFNIIHEGRPGADADGVEFASEKEAWAEAIGSCGEMIRDLDGSREAEADADWRMEVADERRETLFRLRFRAERVGRGTTSR